MNLAIFQHMSLMGKWDDIFFEQYSLLLGSGLLEINKNTKINTCYALPESFEYETLKKLQDYCKHNIDAYVLYMHTKGVSRTGKARECCDYWRKYMEYFLIEQYKSCLWRLVDGFDLAGVDWHQRPEINTRYPHFHGNFWWAAARYINTLEPLKKTKDRFYYERWVGSGKPQVYEIHNSGIKDLSKEVYKPEQYRKDLKCVT
jgi:hypothetical protein